MARLGVGNQRSVRLGRHHHDHSTITRARRAHAPQVGTLLRVERGSGSVDDYEVAVGSSPARSRFQRRRCIATSASSRKLHKFLVLLNHGDGTLRPPIVTD